MSDFKRTLVLGTGPSSIQIIVNLKRQFGCHVGIAGRKSARSKKFFNALEKSNNRICAKVQNQNNVAGECYINEVFIGYETIKEEWDTIIFSVTTDSYLEVLKQINCEVIKKVKSVILVSPTLGSNSLISNYFRRFNKYAEIISFSTYYGDTRWQNNLQPNIVLTTAIKKKLYIGSTRYNSNNVVKLCEMFHELGINVEIMKSPIEAESRNISLYVHPPLLMNDFSLNVIFGDSKTIKYVYKIYPEGPITQYIIRDMLAQWKEIMCILEKLNIQKINLLKFMLDDNYPIRVESLSHNDILNFTNLETIHQEYLLYIRYTSLLIDPFSKPDKNGKYFDFSAVPFRKVFVNNQGYLEIPRMPKEDYYRIKIIQGIAKKFKVDCPTINKFVSIYEEKIKEIAKIHKGQLLSNAFTIQNFENDIKMIFNELKVKA